MLSREPVFSEELCDEEKKKGDGGQAQPKIYMQTLSEAEMALECYQDKSYGTRVEVSEVVRNREQAPNVKRSGAK